jgi:hypothetical protein
VCRYNSVYFNEHSTAAALLSAGSTLALTEAVCRRHLRNGLAIVRPPGHHAEAVDAMGFCMFNNVAIAAQCARQQWGAQRYVGDCTHTLIVCTGAFSLSLCVSLSMCVNVCMHVWSLTLSLSL